MVLSPGSLRTAYEGKCSTHIPPLVITGTPRSGHNLGTGVSAEQRKLRNAWRKEIVDAVRTYKHNLPAGLLPIRSECNLYATFYLDNATAYDGKTRYARMDLDNLLKPLQDTLMNMVIKDDSLFRGVKVRKEPVGSGSEEKVALSVVTTKTLTITKVEEVPGSALVEYWKSPAQVITATDEEGMPGTFIDHMPNVFLRDEYESNVQYRDLVPGYDWRTHQGGQVAGCMVVARRHHLTEEAHRNKSAPGKSCAFHWIHKWSW